MESLDKKKGKGSRKKIVVPFLAAMGIILVFFLLLQLFGGGVDQPLQFNHKIHKENDLECLDCHLYFEDHASSGRPRLETCQGCHEEPLGESKAEKILVDHISSGKELEWKRLYRVPEDVYFSHRRHVILGNIECQICHGDIGESIRPPAKPIKITMKKCMKCHNEKKADNDCIACHR